MARVAVASAAAASCGDTEVPLHVEYRLTDLGHSASVPLAHLRSWALDNMARVPNLIPAAPSS